MLRQVVINSTYRHNILWCVCIITTLFSATLSGCTPANVTQGQESGVLSTYNNESSVAAKATPQKGTRDNSSHIYIPSAPGNATEGDSNVAIDYSNINCGYITLDYKGSNPKPKLQLTGPEGITYTFDIKNGSQVIPLTQSSGNYDITVHENVSDDRYAMIYSTSLSSDMNNDYEAYLYPNVYVDFDASSQVVKEATDLAYSANNDLDVVSSVFNYIIDNISYDKEFAASVSNGYVPYPDNTLQSKKGICFDFASCMAAMLRSQGIPTRLEIGYAGDVYHAWISTYIEDVGWVNGIIQFDGIDWELMDPTFSAKNGVKRVQQYIDDGNYITKYMY